MGKMLSLELYALPETRLEQPDVALPAWFWIPRSLIMDLLITSQLTSFPSYFQVIMLFARPGEKV